VIVDVSDPAAPRLEGSYDTDSLHMVVAGGGNYAYVADYVNVFLIVDVSDPAAPSFKGSYDTDGLSSWSGGAGNYAYVADGGNGLVIVDVSILQSHVKRQLQYRFLLLSFFTRSGVVEKYAYVADGYDSEIFRVMVL